MHWSHEKSRRAVFSTCRANSVSRSRTWIELITRLQNYCRKIPSMTYVLNLRYSSGAAHRHRMWCRHVSKREFNFTQLAHYCPNHSLYFWVNLYIKSVRYIYLLLFVTRTPLIVGGRTCPPPDKIVNIYLIIVFLSLHFSGYYYIDIVNIKRGGIKR